MYFPLPYQTHWKVTFEFTDSTTINTFHYYQVNFRTYLAGTKGNAAVRVLTIKITTSDNMNLALALRPVILKIDFDRQQTVSCPIVYFSGSGSGEKVIKSWYRDFTKVVRLSAGGLCFIRKMQKLRSSIKLHLKLSRSNYHSR